MVGKVLLIEDYLTPDLLGSQIARHYQTWETSRVRKVDQWKEIAEYVFATDTTQTSNSALPWSNTTTLPKLCQIRDNLDANYMAAMFPKRKWLIWEGTEEADEDVDKRKAIEMYMGWVIDRNEFYDEVRKLVLDFIDYGNSFVSVMWVDERNQTPEQQQVGYVGPMVKRISPLDLVFNPTASNFRSSPKIIRSLVSIGEVKEMVEQMGEAEEGERQEAEELLSYMMKTRDHMSDMAMSEGNLTTRDAIYEVAGFGSFKEYLESNFVEILTFYGDIYEEESGVFLRNQVIKVVDRHKILSKKTHPSSFGHAPIYHAGWRIRQDNLWGMGPLDNLIGMQYRIDHLENLKADLFDITHFPPIKIQGYVEDFNWGPMERIYVGDDGDVSLLSPEVQALQADTEIEWLQMKMEEMAGSPKEAMGFRTPGEKTKYEVQRLENAASRIFQNKIAHFERTILEPALNAMLELARRNMEKANIRVFNTEDKVADFATLTAQEITGQGRIRPVAARHFAEQAELVQNITTFYGSGPGQDPEVRNHISSIGLARIFERMLNLEDFNIIEQNIRQTEQANAQRMAQVNQENLAVEQTQESGVLPDDFA